MKKEIRYIIQGLTYSDFKKIKSIYGKSFRIDWFFNGYRIRYGYRENNSKLTGWFKINDSESLNPVKKRIRLESQNKKELDKKCLLKLYVEDKVFISNGLKCYIEHVVATDKVDKVSFFATEDEGNLSENNINELEKRFKLIKIGAVSLKDIALKLLKNKNGN